MDNGRFKNDDVENLSFFHPDLTLLGVCEIMSKNDNKRGIYLLRRSCNSPGSYSISVMHDKNILHFKINRKNDKFFIGDASFNDIPSMVCHFKDYPIVNEQGYLDVYLAQPICRWHGLSSWKDSTLECCYSPCNSSVYLTISSSSRPSSKSSTPELDWEQVPSLTEHFGVTDPYVNQECGRGKARSVSDGSVQTKLNVPLKNGWVLKPLLVFKSPSGEIHENLPRDVWLSLSEEQKQDIQILSDKYDYLEINKKKIGFSRGHHNNC